MTGFATGSVRRGWLGLVLVCALAEALLIGAQAGLWGSPLWRPLSWQYGGFWAGLLYGWTPNYAAQPWLMFVTYGLLHAGWQHLLGNLMTLAWLGHRLERALSLRAFLGFYALAQLGGGLATAALFPGPRPVVGASGAIMGLVALWIAADAREMRAAGDSRRRVLGMVMFRTLVVAALNWLGWRIELGALAWQAHLGGFVAVAVALALGGMRALRPR